MISHISLHSNPKKDRKVNYHYLSGILFCELFGDYYSIWKFPKSWGPPNHPVVMDQNWVLKHIETYGDDLGSTLTWKKTCITISGWVKTYIHIYVIYIYIHRKKKILGNKLSFTSVFRYLWYHGFDEDSPVKKMNKITHYIAYLKTQKTCIYHYLTICITICITRCITICITMCIYIYCTYILGKSTVIHQRFNGHRRFRTFLCPPCVRRWPSGGSADRSSGRWPGKGPLVEGMGKLT